jgi:hypothetical protein
MTLSLASLVSSVALISRYPHRVTWFLAASVSSLAYSLLIADYPRRTTARDGRDDLYLFAVLFDQVAEEQETLVAGAGALFGRWVRGVGQHLRVHFYLCNYIALLLTCNCNIFAL